MLNDTLVPSGLFADEQHTLRCVWCRSTAEYQRYHDQEWGFPVHSDTRLFEKICLEGFQAGLSWLTILNKREAFRAAFAGFDMDKVAQFDEADEKRLVLDAGIVRHRGKIASTINNARKAKELRAEFGSLAAYFWGFGYVAYSTQVFTAAAGNNDTLFQNVGYSTTDRLFLNCDVFNPFATKHTQIDPNSWFFPGGASIGYGGELRDTTQHTGFTISPGSGTMTGGTIRVYGYRN